MKKKFWFMMLMLPLFVQAQMDMTFLTFNVWQEGTSVTNGINKIRDIIAFTKPDIVGFVEVRNYNGEDWTTKIQSQLSAIGHNYYRGYAGGDVSILSKYPISTSGMVEGAVARFGINVNGNLITVFQVHLDYTRYACYLPRGYNGGTPDWNMIDNGAGKPAPVTDVAKIITYNLSSGRDESIRALLSYAKGRSEPLLVLGDFNEPSHQDWTDKTKNLFDHHGTVVPWNSTYSLDSAGFIDTYREFFPDEARNPGISWPSFADDKGPTTWTPLADERDRIDFIFHRGVGISTRFVAMVGPKKSYAFNTLTEGSTANENFLADSLPWPSDHKAVFATIRFPFSSTRLTHKRHLGNDAGLTSLYTLDGKALSSQRVPRTRSWLTSLKKNVK